MHRTFGNDSWLRDDGATVAGAPLSETSFTAETRTHSSRLCHAHVSINVQRTSLPLEIPQAMHRTFGNDSWLRDDGTTVIGAPLNGDALSSRTLLPLSVIPRPPRELYGTMRRPRNLKAPQSSVRHCRRRALQRRHARTVRVYAMHTSPAMVNGRLCR